MGYRYVSLFITLLLIIILNGCSSQQQISEKQDQEVISNTNETTYAQPSQPTWKTEGLAISGQYADAEIINLDNGYRMYYSAEPEISGFEVQLYSATSSDGKLWIQDNGIRMKWATFPSIIRLPDGNYRLYYQNQGVIKSALSSDGLSWNEESGIRVDTQNNVGLNLENVAAPTVIKVGDEYILVYRGTINEKYSNEVPNNNIQLFSWATSDDGLTFNKKGIALDSRNSLFQGLLDGPEFVEWDNGEVRLYFWSYKGIYHITFNNNEFSQDAEFDYTISSNSISSFPENPPGDPTLTKINNKWFMYYGKHTIGIYYTVLE